MNKTKIITLFLLLLVVSRSGPLALGGWTSICAACVKACLATGGLYPICVASCCIGGPLASLFACFADDTTVVTQHGQILLSDAKAGDSVLTRTIEGEVKWTKIKHIVTNSSEFEFVKITTQNHHLSVTANHVMIADYKLVKAKDLKVDSKIRNETVQKVEFSKHANQITVITESGTLLANGLLTTTVCGDYIDLRGNDIEVLSQWRQDHDWLLRDKWEKEILQ